VPSGRKINVTLTAAEAIVEACRTWNPKPAIVSLAPLANIALALALEPRLPQLCAGTPMWQIFLFTCTVLSVASTPYGIMHVDEEYFLSKTADASLSSFSFGGAAWFSLALTLACWIASRLQERKQKRAAWSAATDKQARHLLEQVYAQMAESLRSEEAEEAKSRRKASGCIAQ